MTKINDFETLRRSPLTEGMSDEQCRLLVGISTSRVLKNEEVLIAEGRIDNSFHVILEGSLAVTKDTGGGDWVTLTVLRTGDLAGALGFVDGRPHSATLRAAGEAVVCSFERDKLEGLLDVDPWVVYRVMQAIVHSVHNILTRMNAQYVEMTNYITKQHGRY